MSNTQPMRLQLLSYILVSGLKKLQLRRHIYANRLTGNLLIDFVVSKENKILRTYTRPIFQGGATQYTFNNIAVYDHFNFVFDCFSLISNVC